MNPQGYALPDGDCTETICQRPTPTSIQYACGGLDATLLYCLDILPPKPPDAVSWTSMPDTQSITKMHPTHTTKSEIMSSETAGSPIASVTNSKITATSFPLNPSDKSGPRLGWSTAKMVGVVIGVFFAAALVTTGGYLLVKAYRSKGGDTSSIATWGNSASEEPWGMSQDMVKGTTNQVQILKTPLGTIREQEESVI